MMKITVEYDDGNVLAWANSPDATDTFRFSRILVDGREVLAERVDVDHSASDVAWQVFAALQEGTR